MWGWLREATARASRWKRSRAIALRRHLGGQHLQGDVAPELGIARAIHLPHPARAERRTDLVRSDARADLEGH